MQPKLNCVLGKHIPARGRFSAVVTLILTSVTLELEGDLDILKMYRVGQKSKLLLHYQHIVLKLTSEDSF